MEEMILVHAEAAKNTKSAAVSNKLKNNFHKDMDVKYCDHKSKFLSLRQRQKIYFDIATVGAIPFPCGRLKIGCSSFFTEGQLFFGIL